jgi:prepilin-type processing-associated H-X9-DG protein
MGLALRMYIEDFHAYPPYESFYAEAGRSHNWSYALLPYYHLAWTNASFQCPAYKGFIGEDLNDATAWGSYSYNTFGAVGEPFQVLKLDGPLGLDAPLVGPVLTTHGPRGPAIKESLVVMPSEMFAIMDSLTIPDIPQFGSDFTYCCYPTLEPLQLVLPPQHGKGFNVLSCDGHVAFLKLTDLFNPTTTAQNWNNDHQPHPETWP